MGWKLLIGMFFAVIASVAQETNQIRTIDKGAFGGIQEPLQEVVTNKAAWAELWQKHTAKKLPAPPAPDIDFSRESIIFVSQGRKNTGGFSIEITNVHRAGGKVEVVVAAKEPKPGALAIESLTAPFHIVAVPRIDAPVKFKEIGNKKGA